MSLFAFSSSNRSEKTAVVLGIDGGGTKTEVMLTDLEGTVLASHVGGPTNLAAVAEHVALKNLEESLSAVFMESPNVTVKAAVIGMAGIDTLSDEARFRPLADATFESFGIHDYQLLNDSEVALANGSEAPNALILIAGTGSVCFGRNTEGKTARAGGMDYLLADEGSGYAIGRKVLRAVVRAYDGRGEPTSLTQLVLEHFKINDVTELKQKVYRPQLSKMGIAELAKVWEQAVDKNDEVAKRIQVQILESLEELVVAVVDALDLSTQAFDLVLAGSIAQLPVVEPLLREKLTNRFAHLMVKMPSTTPVHGAVTLALQAVQASAV